MRINSEEPTEQGTAPGNQLPDEQPIGDHSHTYGKPASWLLVGSAANPGVNLGLPLAMPRDAH
jgi:hypothetical protein